MTGERPDSDGGASALPSVLFICMDPVGGAMAGQAIRCVELGRALTEHAAVTIAAPRIGGPVPAGIDTLEFQPHAPGALRSAIAAADLVFAPPQWPIVSRWLAASRAQVVIDLYDPEALETLELFAQASPRRQRLMVSLTLDRLDDALRVGDRFVCASERQRDLWLGALLHARRIAPDAYAMDPTLRTTIGIVPCGVPSERPEQGHIGSGIRGAVPAIADEHEVVLWNGGIWNWLDAPTAIRAIAALAARRPSVRLVFMGASTHEAARAATRQARELADSLGLLDEIVFFHDSWVPYEQRLDWLLDADCALSTHHSHLEARFAWRTRILDCFWAGLPVVCTEGDDLADRVAREELGATAPAGDVEELARALESVLDRGRSAYQPALEATARELAWSRLAEPLLAWLRQPPPAHARARAERPPRPPAAWARRLAYLGGGRLLLARRRRP
jgi:glycosyltransferase involved in cell wall biosynthesis